MLKLDHAQLRSTRELFEDELYLLFKYTLSVQLINTSTKGKVSEKHCEYSRDLGLSPNRARSKLKFKRAMKLCIHEVQCTAKVKVLRISEDIVKLDESALTLQVVLLLLCFWNMEKFVGCEHVFSKFLFLFLV